MDNIWIFIVIIGAVISFAQKNQKKPMTESDDVPQPNPQEEWERQLREILGEKPQTPAAPKPASQSIERDITPEYKQPAHIHSKRIVAPLPKSKAAIQQPINAKKEKAQEVQVKHEGEVNIESIIDDFSMEKAVIYAEILKPKYEEY